MTVHSPDVSRTSGPPARRPVERAGLLEQMRGAGDDLEPLVAGQLFQGLLVELYDAEVCAHRRSAGSVHGCAAGMIAAKVGSPAARDDRGDVIGSCGSSNECRGRPGAGTEQADRQTVGLAVVTRPADRFCHARAEQGDVEHIGAVVRLRLCQEVEQQRGQVRAQLRPARHWCCAGSAGSSRYHVRR